MYRIIPRSLCSDNRHNYRCWFLIWFTSHAPNFLCEKRFVFLIRKYVSLLTKSKIFNQNLLSLRKSVNASTAHLVYSHFFTRINHWKFGEKKKIWIDKVVQRFLKLETPSFLILYLTSKFQQKLNNFVNSFFLWKMFSNFVAFSKYPNFKGRLFSLMSVRLWNFKDGGV